MSTRREMSTETGQDPLLQFISNNIEPLLGTFGNVDAMLSRLNIVILLEKKLSRRRGKYVQPFVGMVARSRLEHTIADNDRRFQKGVLVTLKRLKNVINNTAEISVQVQREAQAFLGIIIMFLKDHTTGYDELGVLLEQLFQIRRIKDRFKQYIQTIESHRAALDILLGSQPGAVAPELRWQASQMVDVILIPGDREAQAAARIGELCGAVDQDPQAMQEIAAMLADNTSDYWLGIQPRPDPHPQADSLVPSPRLSPLHGANENPEFKRLALLPDTIVTTFTFHGEQPRIRHASLTLVARGAPAYVYRAEIYAGPHIFNAALKVLPKFDTDVHNKLRAREMALWPTLHHKHVLPCYGSCDLGDDKIALISPFMENGTMIQYLKEHPSANKLSIVEQVVEGVRYLHEKAGVVHGDLKCENVLISSSGSALIGDFGLITTIEANADDITMTAIRNKNTLPFTAPELLFGEDAPAGSDPTTIPSSPGRSKTAPGDVYALAMLIYQAYTLAPPWAGVEPSNLVLRIREGNGPPRTFDERGVPVIPDAVWTICSSMWKVSPGDRPTVDRVLMQVKALRQGNSDISSV